MSEFRNNKHYSYANGYHNIRVNGHLLQSIYTPNNVIINVLTDSDMTTDTHIKSVVVSDTNKDGKYVEHIVARDGSFTHYDKDKLRTENIKVNGSSIHTNPAVSIMTTWHIRDTFSSKITTAVASETPAEDTGPSIQWFG